MLVDTTLDEPDMAVSQIASDNTAGGKEAAKTLLELIGGKGKVPRRQRRARASRPPTRAARASRRAPRQPGVEYLGQQYNNDEPGQGRLDRHRDAGQAPRPRRASSPPTCSAPRAPPPVCAQAGKLGKVKIVGFDAGPKQVEDLKDGIVQALIAQQPAEIGKQGVDQALNALNGEPVTKKIGTGFSVITKNNLADLAGQLYKASC